MNFFDTNLSGSLKLNNTNIVAIVTFFETILQRLLSITQPYLGAITNIDYFVANNKENEAPLRFAKLKLYAI